MTMKSYLDLSSRFIRVQKKRAVLTVIGIILSVALITGLGTLVTSWQASMVRNAIRDNGDFYTAFTNVPGGIAQKIMNHVEIEKSTVVRNDGFAALTGNASGSGRPPFKYLSIVAASPGAWNMFPTDIKEGRFPESPDEIAIDYWMLQELPEGTRIGDTITLSIGERISPDGAILVDPRNWDENERFIAQETQEFTLVGLLNPKMIIDRNFAQGITFLDKTMLSDQGQYTVFSKLYSIDKVHEISQSIAKDAGIKLEGETGLVFNENVLRLQGESGNPFLNKAVILTLIVIMLFIVIATIAVIYNTFNMSVVEKVSQYGLLRCVGATPGQIRKTVYKEAGILAGIGIPIGVFCGTVAMGILFSIIKAIAPTVQFSTLELVISPAILIGSILVGILTVFVSACLPARRAARVSPMEAVRNTGEFKKENYKKISRSRILYRLMGTEAWIAWKNIGRNRKRFYITVFSMVISIALFIAFGSMVDFGYKSAIVEKNYNPSFTLNNVNGKRLALTDSENEEIKNLSGVDHVFRHSETYAEAFLDENKVNEKSYNLMNSTPVYEDGKIVMYNCRLICYGDDSFEYMNEFLVSDKIDLRQMLDENGVVVVNTGMVFNSELKRSEVMETTYLAPGDSFMLKIPKQDNVSQENVQVKVSAVLSQSLIGETRNLNGGIIIITSEEVYKGLVGEGTYPLSLMIKMKDNADGTQVREYLDNVIGKNADLTYQDFDQAMKDYNSQWMVIAIFMYGFVAVITLIGFVNIVNSIGTNILLRSRELSMLRAIGASESDIKRLVRLESIFYGITSSIIGVVLGSMMSYALYNTVRGIRDFAWSLPVNQILIAIVGAISLAVISGYIPLKRINRGIIIEGIRVEE